MSCRLCPVINQSDESAAATRRRRDDESRAVNATAVSQVTDLLNHLMMSSAAYLQHDSHVGERTCVSFAQILNLQVHRPISWLDPQLCRWDLLVFVSVSASGDSASEVQPQTPNDCVVLAAWWRDSNELFHLSDEKLVSTGSSVSAASSCQTVTLHQQQLCQQLHVSVNVSTHATLYILIVYLNTVDLIKDQLQALQFDHYTVSVILSVFLILHLFTDDTASLALASCRGFSLVFIGWSGELRRSGDIYHVAECWIIQNLKSTESSESKPGSVTSLCVRPQQEATLLRQHS